MEILKCNADYNKVYYVCVDGGLHQCKLLRTESTQKTPVYVLDVAQMGVVRIEAERFRYFDKWYHSSKIPSILYESVDDFRKNNPIMDNYGSTDNCYNGGFICGLFKKCSTCNCGGLIYTWKWNGCKAVKYIVGTKGVAWTWDADGFHCELNGMYGCYRTEQECIKNNEVSVVTF